MLPSCCFIPPLLLDACLLLHPSSPASSLLSCLTPASSPACMQVGLLDIDICGPSAPKMFGLEGHEVRQ